jgi:hypothetical protein
MPMIMIRLRRFFLPLLLPFTSASCARPNFFSFLLFTTKVVWVLFLLQLACPGLAQHRPVVALDRPTPEMEAENLFANQEPAVPEANHKIAVFCGLASILQRLCPHGNAILPLGSDKV